MMSVKVYVSFKYKEMIKDKLFYVIAITLILIAPIFSFAEKKPDWVDGWSNFYPEKKYLIGVGYGATREIAEKDAYGAISRIFSANVLSISRDYERYSQTKKKDKTDTYEEMEIERIVKVTTDKILENVSIAETWYDSEQKVYYTLAIMDRLKAGNSLKEQILILDMQAEDMVKKGRETTVKIQKIKSLKGAIRILLRREAYNKDLRVINLSGKGIDSPISLSEISNELDNFLKNDFSIGVYVAGGKGDDITNAIIEGLNIQGFSVSKGNQTEDLSIEGEVEFKEVYIENPEFKFVRWTANFKLVDKSTSRVIGSINNSGKEGHLTIKDAEERALNRMKEDISYEVSKKLTDFIF